MPFIPAVLQAQCLCLNIRRLPQRLDVGCETFPLTNLSLCWHGVCRVFVEGPIIMNYGPLCMCAPLPCVSKHTCC